MTVDPEARRVVVEAFYQKAMNERHFEGALPYPGSHYRQHNPLVEDGHAGLHKYLDWIRENFPHARSRVVRVFADQDHVILHVHRVRTPGTKGDAIVDIFRLEGSKIVEH